MMRKMLVKIELIINIDKKIRFSFESDEIFKILNTDKKHIIDDIYKINIFCIIKKYDKSDGMQKNRYVIESFNSSDTLNISDEAIHLKYINGVFIFFYRTNKYDKMTTYLSYSKKINTGEIKAPEGFKL